MTAWVLGEFDSGTALIEAVKKARASGFAGLDTHTPYPLHDSDAALGLRPSIVPRLALVGGLLGAGFAYWFQWYLNAVAYPIIVGARPPHSPAANVPIVFEMTVLTSATFIFLGLMLLFGFPRPWHPVFEAPGFERASASTFWMSATASRREEVEELTKLFREHGASSVSVVQEEA